MSRAVLERAGPKFERVSPSGSAKVLWLPFAAAILLAAFPVFVPRVGDHPDLANTFWGVSGALSVFLLILRRQVIRARRTLRYEVVLAKAHYVQLTMHICVYAYWGWYWREVYDYIPLLAAQIIFTYALDMLVCWSRRDKWILGFGPFPIVLSTSLFLWFRDEWFYLQFLLIATGVLGKEFIRWKREGRPTHIFNPSALSLFVFSIALIATKNTGMTWGIEIADTLHRPPHIYLEIFLLGLVVQSLFRVTLVTLFSTAALCVLNLLYTRVTGDFNFIDSSIPVSVFLGLHLLVTDPATSPRKSLGKILFGLMYGAGVFGMYRFLSFIGAPEFYDKLLCVPVLNLTVQVLDRISDGVNGYIQSIRFPFRRTFWSWTPQRSNFAWMSVWCVFFTVMVTTGFLAKGKDHPGGDPEYWHRGCEAGRQTACETWARALNVICDGNVAEACFTLAGILDAGQLIPRDTEKAGVLLGRACDLGSNDACSRLMRFVHNGGAETFSKACQRGDGASCFILGSLYSGGAGVQQDASAAFDLFHKSCDLGWPRGCGRLGMSYLVGQGTPVNPGKAAENFELGCEGRNGASCFEAGKLYFQGTDGEGNKLLARKRFQQACELGVQQACTLAGS